MEWIAEKFVREIPPEISIDFTEFVSFQDRPSRPSKALINEELFIKIKNFNFNPSILIFYNLGNKISRISGIPEEELIQIEIQTYVKYKYKNENNFKLLSNSIENLFFEISTYENISNYIFKLENIYTKSSIYFIDFIRKLFEICFLIKPRTSEFFNSEIYLVGLNRKTINLDIFNDIIKNGKFFKGEHSINPLLESIFDYNQILMNTTCKYAQLYETKLSPDQRNEIESINTKRAYYFLYNFVDKVKYKLNCPHINFILFNETLKKCKNCMRFFK